MVGPVALIALIALVIWIVRYKLRGEGWLLATITGVKHALLGLIVLYGLLILLAVGAGTTRAILHPVGDTLIALFPDTQPPASRAGQRLETRPNELLAAVTPLPTPTPRVVVAHAPQPPVKVTPVSLAYEAVVSPPLTPTSTPAPAMPTATPEPTETPEPTATPDPTPAPDQTRSGCDPAYPDSRTCIPPGPPFDQGCAITDERRFTVLPPDPQGLDHDKDGIGCEPVA